MNCCVVGLQWGDEGKGKIVDIFARESDIVVRYSGGANAGHTVVVGEDKFALHLLPSGATRPDKFCVIGNGVVVDAEVLISEIEALAAKNISLENRLFISENAHLVMEYHKQEDKLREQALGNNKIGTTARGIGPCYADKIGRTYTLRAGDLRDTDDLKKKLENILAYKNKLFAALYGAQTTDLERIFQNCLSHSEKLRGAIRDTTEFLHKAIYEGKSVLFEGAQGTLLDIDHGTFPYVTSSNASALGMPAGSGVPGKLVDKFIGVAKAYTSRVGAGPFPTEQDNETGRYLREKGNEYGTTTGRPRRCGWFDAVAVSYAANISAVDSIALMHLDTLTGLEEIKVCKEYKLDGNLTRFFPSNTSRLSRVECIYESFPGWQEQITGVKDFHDLPVEARNLICGLEELTNRPITIVGVGPERSQTIFR